MTHSGLELHSLSIFLKETPLVLDLDLHVASREITTIMGPSGSGKSTILSVICGTLDPAFRFEGDVRIKGQSMTAILPEKRRVGILFQDDMLFPHMTVGDNLAFGLPRGLPLPERQQKIDFALRQADLAGFSHRDPATLSGGQRARIACLRTLMASPDILLLDEPFSKLDSVLREKFRTFVFTQARTRNIPVLLVTHDPQDARSAGGVVVTLGTDRKALYGHHEKQAVSVIGI